MTESGSLRNPPITVMDSKKSKADMTLPDVVIIEIFSRLPVKSLCRFKCVSKSCLSFIEDSFFIEKIRLKTPLKWQFHVEETIDIFLIDVHGRATHVHTYKFENDTKLYKLRCGFVCYLDADFGFCLYNITTNQGILLPEWCDDFELSFDPTSKKYKILGWADDAHVLDFQVLTLEKDPSWRPVMNPLRLTSLSDADTAFNGNIFWLWLRKHKIISFNLANEEFREIVLPGENNGSAYSIFEFEGSLSLVEQRREERPSFNLWMLKDIDGSYSWNVMKKNITLPFEETTFPEYPDYIWTLHDPDYADFTSRGGEILITVTDDGTSSNYIFFFSPLNGQLRLMTVSADLNYFNFKIKNYVENYLSLEELGSEEL